MYCVRLRELMLVSFCWVGRLGPRRFGLVAEAPTCGGLPLLRRFCTIQPLCGLGGHFGGNGGKY